MFAYDLCLWHPGLQVKVEGTPDGSILTLLSVGRTDSGNYTCSPANAQQASITLHIILGKHGQLCNYVAFRGDDASHVVCNKEIDVRTIVLLFPYKYFGMN